MSISLLNLFKKKQYIKITHLLILIKIDKKCFSQDEIIAVS